MASCVMGVLTDSDHPAGKENLDALDGERYPFIVAARIRNEAQAMQEEILRRCAGLRDGPSLHQARCTIAEGASCSGCVRTMIEKMYG